MSTIVVLMTAVTVALLAVYELGLLEGVEYAIKRCDGVSCVPWSRERERQTNQKLRLPMNNNFSECASSAIYELQLG